MGLRPLLLGILFVFSTKKIKRLDNEENAPSSMKRDGA